MKIKVILLSILIMCVGVLVSAGMSPKTIHIQVRLSNDTAGQNPVEGKVSMVIRIFDAPAGGNLLWNTKLPAANFHKGIFEADLGNSGSVLPAAVFSEETRSYLQVEINGEIKSPRQIISATADPKETQPAHDKAYLQPGAIAFFDLPECPAGWSEFAPAQGRYIVGLNPSGTPGATVGIALSDLENRPVGKHAHTINDPGHNHSCWNESGCDLIWPGDIAFTFTNGYEAVSINYTGVTILAEGSTAGTNAPYAKYILCVYLASAAPEMKIEVSIRIKNKENNIQIDDRKYDPEAISVGMLLFFNRPQCPPGWNEVTSAQGRYLVALIASGTQGEIVGTALSDQENRPVGQHAHSINDPGHTHNRIKRIQYYPNQAQYKMTPSYLIISESVQSSVNTTGISINSAGSIAGTNAPYAQLLLCEYTGTFKDNPIADKEHLSKDVPVSHKDKNSEMSFLSPQGEFPPGSVIYFNSVNCPTGWNDFAKAQGRYFVALPSQGLLGAAIGTALTDQENRAVGQHNHAINDPGHSHGHSRQYTQYQYYGYVQGSLCYCHSLGSCTFSTTGITVNEEGSVAGTNAPYIQLLACQANVLISAPGKVLNSLMITKSSGNPVLNWDAVGGACTVTAYGVYRGTLPFSNYNHASLNCSVSATTYTDAQANDSYYYLVVPNNSSDEGSYGTDSSGTERPQGSSPCRTQNVAICN